MYVGLNSHPPGSLNTNSGRNRENMTTTATTSSTATDQQKNHHHHHNNNNNNKNRILSIQSHVVSGYVGNKSAVFPLQLLGYEVDYVNSVQFSNHTGYKKGFRGEALKGEQLQSILNGLVDNELLHDTGHLLTGYIGSESFLTAVLDVLQTLRKINPSVRYICDPVLGDDGPGFYVPQEFVQVFKTQLIPAADVITPNRFEAEQLTGIRVDSVEDAVQACRVLHDMGPSLVFVTSFRIKRRKQQQTDESDQHPNKGDDDEEGEDMMSIMASERILVPPNDGSSTLQQPTQTQLPQQQQQQRIWCIDFPVIPFQFTGTGDLCTALLLAHTAKTTKTTATDRDGTTDGREDEVDPIAAALERTINTMYAVLQRTYQCALEHKRRHENTNNPNLESCVFTARERELKLIQSKHDIEHPPQRFKARRIQ